MGYALKAKIGDSKKMPKGSERNMEDLLEFLHDSIEKEARKISEEYKKKRKRKNKQ